MSLADRDYYGEKYWELIEKEESSKSKYPRKEFIVRPSKDFFNPKKKFDFGKFIFLIFSIFAGVALVLQIIPKTKVLFEKSRAAIEKTPPHLEIFPLPKEKEAKVGGVLFKLIKVEDLGKVLKASESREPEYVIKDITTEGRFIRVIVSAENKYGKETIREWGLMEIVDSEGRKFTPITGVSFWLPEENVCFPSDRMAFASFYDGLLKPGFGPKTCAAIYEVAPDSTGLRLIVGAGEETGEINLGI